MPLLVFSDLDGTLLDHHDYSWQEARPGLDRLRDIGAGLVLASSKTGAELRALQADIGCTGWPAIVENGAGILWPEQDAGAEDGDYRRIRAVLRDLPPGFIGFGDLDDAGVARLTGLAPEAAHLARLRQHSEPGLWQGDADALPAFLRAAEAAGLHARRGGRFLTLSFGRTKADAMAEVVAALKPRRTIALGDAPNDVEMLDAADFGVVIANPHAPPIPPLPYETGGRIVRTTKPGPEGWAEAILSLTTAPG
nr:HAD hydrolase family protein [Thetidibacter halocola]